jgi:hypothetical protein
MEESMSDSLNTDRTQSIAWHAAGTAPEHVAEYQKMALHHQQELFEDAQQRVMAWSKRRQEALATGIDALKRMSASHNPVAAAAICGEWMSGSLSRLFADLDDAHGHALKVAEQFHNTSKAVLDRTKTEAAIGTEAASAVAKDLASAGQAVTQPLREAAD